MKSLQNIAKMYHCSADTIRRNLEEYKIKRRKTGEGRKGQKQSELFIILMKKKNKGRGNPFSGKHHTEESKEKIRLKNKGRKYGKEIRKKLSLAHGGTGIPYEHNLYPSEFHEIRLKILKRDNYTCQICNKKGNQVHHIDYNKQNNKSSNLITLCKKCNIQANYNKIKWIKLLKKLI
jgi:hypothetical protein